MKILVPLFLAFTFVFASHIEIPLPIGQISNHPIYGPLNYTVLNMRLSFIDPGIGLNNVTYYRVYDRLPEKFSSSLLPILAYHINEISANNGDKGEILIVISPVELRLVLLKDGHLDHLIPSSTKMVIPKSKCSPIFDGHYGTVSCSDRKELIFYLLTPGSTYYYWEFAEGKNDPPLDLKGIQWAIYMSQELDNIDIVLSGSGDASAVTAEIIANSLGVDLWIDEVFSIGSGLQYESWRLFKRNTSYYSSKSIIQLIDKLSRQFSSVLFVMDPCMAYIFLKSIGYQQDVKRNILLKIEYQNQTGISHWNVDALHQGVYSSELCVFPSEIISTLDFDLLQGSKIDYTISRSHILKLTQSEQNNYIRLIYERSTWTKLYWTHRELFKEGLLHEKHGIRYWGKFPIYEPVTEELIGVYWTELVKNIWF